MVEILTGTSTSKLGNPAKCRAFIAHATKDVIDRPALFDYASELIDLHHRWVFPDEVEHRQRTLGQDTINALFAHDGFNPKSDYLVTGGDPLILARVLWQLRSLESLTLLRYDRHQRAYFPFRLTDS